MQKQDKQELILRISGVNARKCMRCGKCSATCPAYDEMEYHPHQFVYMVESGNIEPLLSSDSIYKCLTCFACVERCPRDVQPAKLIEAVRLAVIREQDKNHVRQKDRERRAGARGHGEREARKAQARHIHEPHQHERGLPRREWVRRAKRHVLDGKAEAVRPVEDERDAYDDGTSRQSRRRTRGHSRHDAAKPDS